MLDDDRIADVAAQVAADVFSGVRIRRVMSEPIIDSVGDDALRITMVIEQDDVEKLTGEQTIDFLMAVHRSLENEGEQRNSVVEYATEEELLSDDE